MDDRLEDIGYRIETLCIYVRARDSRGRYRPFSYTREHLAEAFDEARISTLGLFNRGIVINEEDLRDSFLEYLERNINHKFGYGAVRMYNCSGDIPRSDYKNKLFGENSCVNTW